VGAGGVANRGKIDRDVRDTWWEGKKGNNVLTWRFENKVAIL
jgi:hypothetical protein